MHFLSRFKIVTFNISVIFGSDNNQYTSSNPNGNISDLAPSTDDQDQNFENISSKVEYEMHCPICLENLPKLEGNYDLKNPLFYENSLFKCPQEIPRTYFYKCIDILRRNYTKENPSAAVKCPCCRTDLKDAIKTYWKNFIEKFLNNPKNEMIETLGLILSDFDGSDIFTAKLTDEIDFCKNILKLIKNLSGKNIYKIKKILRTKIIELETEKICAEELNVFCFKLENDPTNVCLTLQKNTDFIKLLTTAQIFELLERIVEIKYVEIIELIKSLDILFDFIIDEDLIDFDENEQKFYKILMICLKSRTIEGLRLFIKLNKLHVKLSFISINKIFASLASISNEFESDILFFEASKEFVLKISGNNDDCLKKYILRLPQNCILKKEFNFLLEHFSENVIFSVVCEFLKKPETTKIATDFLFLNDLFSRIQGLLEKIVGIFTATGAFKPYLIDKEGFGYFMSNLIKRTNFLNLIEDLTILKIIISCVEYKLPNEILKPFEQFIDHNLFNIVKCENREFAQYLFKLLNELKGENKEDYQRFDLNSEFYFNKSNLEILLEIIQPESIFPTLKIICEASNNFVDLTNKFKREDLRYLISQVIQKCLKKLEMIDILTKSLPEEFKFLVKTYIIVFLCCLNDRKDSSRIKKDLKKYLLENLKLTPILKRNIKSKKFDILNYICSIYNEEENFDELRSIVETIETKHLIDIYERMNK